MEIFFIAKYSPGPKCSVLHFAICNVKLRVQYIPTLVLLKMQYALKSHALYIGEWLYKLQQITDAFQNCFYQKCYAFFPQRFRPGPLKLISGKKLPQIFTQIFLRVVEISKFIIFLKGPDSFSTGRLRLNWPLIIYDTFRMNLLIMTLFQYFIPEAALVCNEYYYWFVVTLAGYKFKEIPCLCESYILKKN